MDTFKSRSVIMLGFTGCQFGFLPTLLIVIVAWATLIDMARKSKLHIYKQQSKINVFLQFLACKE